MTTSLTNAEKATIVNSRLKNLNYNKFSLEIDKVVENAKADPDEEALANYTAFLADNAIQIAALITELAKYPVEEA
jgi:hypothetical protein